MPCDNRKCSLGFASKNLGKNADSLINIIQIHSNLLKIIKKFIKNYRLK